MAFEYIGLGSLLDPAIFTKIYARAVEDTGLAYAFSGVTVLDPKAMDRTLVAFRRHVFNVVTTDGLRDTKQLWLIVAAGIHSASQFAPIPKGALVKADVKVVGIHEGAIRKNPNEAIALTFGLALAQIEFELKRHPTGLIMSPAPVDLRDIGPVELRRCIHQVAEIRNQEIALTKSRQFLKSFFRPARVMQALRDHQLARMRQT